MQTFPHAVDALMIRRKATPLTITLVAAATMLLGRSVTVAAQVVVVQPFYLEQTTSATNSDTGVFGPYKTKTVARRSDGVTAVVDGLGPNSSGRIREVTSPDGLAVTAWENVKLKTTWPPKNEEAMILREQLKNVSPECRVVSYDAAGQEGERFLRFDTVNDQRVVVVQSVAANYIITTWKAPALACQELHYTSEKIGPGGSHVLSWETVTTHLQLGEPDPRLFTVDADYAESKPSVALRALIRSVISIPEDEANLRHEGEMLDRRYQSR
jgi:hypothetical protein